MRARNLRSPSQRSRALNELCPESDSDLETEQDSRPAGDADARRGDFGGQSLVLAELLTSDHATNPGQQPEVGRDSSQVGEPHFPDPLDKVLIFRHAWSLVTAVSFWSLLQGKTEKIRKARYGLDQLRALLLLEKASDERVTQASLLRDVTDVLFSHRIGRREEVGSDQPMLPITCSGQKFVQLLFLTRNRRFLLLILNDAKILCDRIRKDDQISFGQNILGRDYDTFVSNTNRFAQSADQVGTQGQVGPVLSFLMQWSKLRYCLEEFRFQPDKRDIVEWKALANSFFLVNRERRALLDRDARGDALIAQMRAAEKEQKKSASSGAAVTRR